MLGRRASLSVPSASIPANGLQPDQLSTAFRLFIFLKTALWRFLHDSQRMLGVHRTVKPETPSKPLAPPVEQAQRPANAPLGASPRRVEVPETARSITNMNRCLTAKRSDCPACRECNTGHADCRLGHRSTRDRNQSLHLEPRSIQLDEFRAESHCMCGSGFQKTTPLAQLKELATNQHTSNRQKNTEAMADYRSWYADQRKVWAGTE
jgi:hypothetical protein